MYGHSRNYFGARYYASQLGRFLTLGWSDAPEPIPYANLKNPQSLNLYSYVLNNPASDVDPDGHGEELDFIGGDPLYFRTDAEYASWLDKYGADAFFPAVGESGPIYAKTYDGPLLAGYATYIPDPVTVSSFLLAPAKSFYTHFVDLFLNENPRAIPGLLLALGSAVAPEGEVAEGAFSTYLDKTAGSAAERNIETNVTKEEFERNLEASGFRKTTPEPDRDQFIAPDGRSYDVYRARPTGGWSAQFKASPSSRVTLKIRLGGGE